MSLRKTLMFVAVLQHALTAIACSAELEPMPADPDARVGAEPDPAVADASSVDAAASDASVALPDVVGEGYVRFQARTVDDDGLLRLAFDVPPGAESFVLTVAPGRSPRRIGLVELRGPDSKPLFDSTAEDRELPYRPNRLVNGSDWQPFTTLLPNAPVLEAKPGRYEALLHVDGSDAPIEADVVFALEATEEDADHLDVVLRFAPGASRTARDARSDPDFLAMLDEMVRIFREAGIEIDGFELGDIHGPERWGTLDDDAELAELVHQTRGTPEHALQIVFVDEIVAEGATLLGRTSGIPGPPPHPALERRGAVVLALDALPSSNDRAGEILAHEAAHYLGLGHTSSFDGTRFDPIADTPECPAERATGTTTSGARVLLPRDCADLDGYNLLFYTPPLDATAQDRLTEGQAWVLRRSPLVQ